jgi:hypothetical protein
MSFHIISADSQAHWDSIVPLGGYIAAQNPPPGIPNERWAQNISVTWYGSGVAMADAIAGGLNPPNNRARVMIDELRGDSIQMVADCARTMQTQYPQWAGRWGCYLVNGTNVAYTGLQPAIDELLDARAMISCELYAKESDYHNAGSSTGEKDTWLGDFYRGSRGAFPQGRLHWLVQRRKSRGSDSHISALFGVTDKFVSNWTFLDRCFYVFVNRSGYRGLLLSSNGGAGSWKWDRDGLSSSSRDVRFSDSWRWYCEQGKTNLSPR